MRHPEQCSAWKTQLLANQPHVNVHKKEWVRKAILQKSSSKASPVTKHFPSPSGCRWAEWPKSHRRALLPSSDSSTFSAANTRVPLVSSGLGDGKNTQKHTELHFFKPKGSISPVTGLSKYRAVIISYKLPITCPGDSCSPVVGQPGQAAWQSHGVTRRGDKYDIPGSLEPRETLISNIDLKI